MTGAPYGSWGTGQDRPSGSAASGGPPAGPPQPGSSYPPPHQQPYEQANIPQPPYNRQQNPYAPLPPYNPQQNPYNPQSPYNPSRQPVQGARPYALFGSTQSSPPPAPPGSRPIGPDRPPSVSISAYQPPKRRVGALVAFLVGFAVLIGGFMAVSYLARTAPTAASSSPSATATLPGLAFETHSATGAWEITNTQWSSGHVLLTVRVTVATGSFRYSFYAYNNAAMRLSYPDSGSSSTLRSGTLVAGQTVSGTLLFQIAHGDGTLVLLDAMENQVSGLPIKP